MDENARIQVRDSLNAVDVQSDNVVRHGIKLSTGAEDLDAGGRIGRDWRADPIAGKHVSPVDSNQWRVRIASLRPNQCACAANRVESCSVDEVKAIHAVGLGSHAGGVGATVYVQDLVLTAARNDHAIAGKVVEDESLHGDVRVIVEEETVDIDVGAGLGTVQFDEGGRRRSRSPWCHR